MSELYFMRATGWAGLIIQCWWQPKLPVLKKYLFSGSISLCSSSNIWHHLHIRSSLHEITPNDLIFLQQLKCKTIICIHILFSLPHSPWGGGVATTAAAVSSSAPSSLYHLTALHLANTSAPTTTPPSLHHNSDTISSPVKIISTVMLALNKTYPRPCHKKLILMKTFIFCLAAHCCSYYLRPCVIWWCSGHFSMTICILCLIWLIYWSVLRENSWNRSDHQWPVISTIPDIAHKHWESERIIPLLDHSWWRSPDCADFPEIVDTAAESQTTVQNGEDNSSGEENKNLIRFWISQHCL